MGAWNKEKRRGEPCWILADIRHERQITQTDLANAIGVTPHTIRIWETVDFNPRLRHYRALCKALKIDSDLLL